jgi:hypothetical protein
METLDTREGAPAPTTEPFPMPEIDGNGIDRSQIRRSLALTPLERLRRHDDFMRSMMAIWRQNGHEGFR